MEYERNAAQFAIALFADNEHGLVVRLALRDFDGAEQRYRRRARSDQSQARLLRRGARPLSFSDSRLSWARVKKGGTGLHREDLERVVDLADFLFDWC